MDIARDRFPKDVIKIIEEIADSHFIAFDLEFSGVAGRTTRLTPGKPTLQELYEEAKNAAERYEILQFGITIVQEDVSNGCYVVKPYNFDITQIPTLHERIFKRNWSMSSGAIGFLLRNGFDFGKQISQGIHFLSRTEEDQVRQTLLQNESVKRPDMTLKPEDDVLIDHIRSSVRRWLAVPERDRESFLNIPSDTRAKRVPGTLNRYQVRLTHQIVQNEYPALKTQGMNHFVQITQPSVEALKEKKAMEEKSINREIARAVGFRWLLEAIAGADIRNLPEEYLMHTLGDDVESETARELARDQMRHRVDQINHKLQDRRKILIGHNCFTDLVNLHKFMMGWLPERIEDFTESLRATFPAIVDTKHIASLGNARWGDTSLAKVEEDLRDEAKPLIVIQSEFDRYRFDDFEHEAGYDSLLTAKIAIRASTKMEREGIFRQEQYLQPGYISTGTAYLGIEEGYASAQEVPNRTTNTTDLTTDNVVAVNAAQGSAAPIDPTSVAGSQAELVAVKDFRSNATTHDEAAGTNQATHAFANESLKATLESQLSKEQKPSHHGFMNLKIGEHGHVPAEPIDNSAQEITAMVKKGELMPRWDGDFWTRFGNRLQVNGSQEGICIL